MGFTGFRLGDLFGDELILRRERKHLMKRDKDDRFIIYHYYVTLPKKTVEFLIEQKQLSVGSRIRVKEFEVKEPYRTGRNLKELK